MNTPRTFFALALAAPLSLLGCQDKSSGGTVASSVTATPAAGAACPPGSTLGGTACKGAGTSRVATITWAGAITDNGPTLTVKNTSGFGLKNATVSLWFYDKTGHRLDVAGAKKYSSSADVLGSSTFAAGGSKDTTFNFMKANIPTGTAQIEGEIVAATLVKPDGTEGNTWKNDDINADERAMTGTPQASAATAPQYAANPGTAAPPGAPTPPTAPTAHPTTTATTPPHATTPTATHRPGGPPPAPGHH